MKKLTLTEVLLYTIAATVIGYLVFITYGAIINIF